MMLKVFLVEDEKIMREGIKNNIDWEKEGFSFVGDAGRRGTGLSSDSENPAGHSDHRYQNAFYGRTGAEPVGEAGNAQY